MKNEKGMTLVEILIAVAIAGGVALMVMKLVENMKTVENRSAGVMDAREVLSEIRMIIENEKNCKLSLVNPEGPDTTFRKSEIDGPGKDSGLPIELWIGNPEGTKRTQKRYYDGVEVGKTKINSIRLFMNKSIGPDYPQGAITDFGVLKVNYSFSGQGQKTIVRDFLLNVDLQTNASGVSTLLGCQRDGIKTMCDAMNMQYDSLTQKCLNPVDECDDWKVLAGENWNGWKEVTCDRVDGGYVQSILFGQSRTGETDNNSMKIKCCYSRKYHLSDCSNPVELAGTSWWEGNKSISCIDRPRGFIRKIELYQGNASGKDTNGMKVQCCYPN